MKYLHTMIRIADINESLDFFVGKMGMQEVRRVENEAGRFTLIFLAAPGDVDLVHECNAPLLELTYNWDGEVFGEPTRNWGHLAYAVDNIYDYCQSLMDNGVVINRPPRDGRMAFIKSPNGISIELLQKGDALEPCEPWISMENIGTW